MWKILIIAAAFLFTCTQVKAENPLDTYDYKSSCPANPNWTEPNTKFAACNCTSYVANKLNQLWSQDPKFVNTKYYTKTDSERWGDAQYWQKKAVCVGIGATKATDNFPWEPDRYNAVFYGDVAWWGKWNETDGKYGHVAFVESFVPGAGNQGVQCVTVSEYNYNPPYDFRWRDICKGDGQRFPDYFLHIDQDHIYCLQNPDKCPGFTLGDPKTCNIRSGGNKGGGSDPFNLIVNDFRVKNAAGTTLIDGVNQVTPGQVVTIRIQVKAKEGNTSTHMRLGKSRIEVDIYVRQDTGDWVFLKREYIQAVNLPSGATHTESVTYTVPQGVREVSFKAEIDAEDEAYEVNEGDNWTEIQTFQMDYSWLIPIINLILED
jgi:surface antigen